MPKYTVKHTPIKHGKKGDKEATLYNLGDEIELTEKEAALIGDNLELVPEEPKKEKDKK